MPLPVDSRPYRRGVGIALINAHGKVFVGQRLDSAEPAWQMPQGGIDKGEDPRAAALRELGEETGVAPSKVEIISETKDWVRYDLPAEISTKMWKGKYRGQEQMWFLMRFNGVDHDININTAHPEFSAWKWLNFQQLPNVIVGFKRPIYVQVVEAFEPIVSKISAG